MDQLCRPIPIKMKMAPSSGGLLICCRSWIYDQTLYARVLLLCFHHAPLTVLSLPLRHFLPCLGIQPATVAVATAGAARLLAVKEEGKACWASLKSLSLSLSSPYHISIYIYIIIPIIIIRICMRCICLFGCILGLKMKTTKGGRLCLFIKK